MSKIEYVIYCRKSSDESSGNQKQSIPDQIKACLSYAKREKLDIKLKPRDFSLFENEMELQKENNESDILNNRIYKESRKYYIIKEQETGKIPGKRTKWNRLIDQIEKGNIKGLLSYSPDRQARNMLEGGKLIDLVDNDKIDLKYTNFHFENNASGKMMLGIWFVFSKQYSDKLSEDITRGNKNKVAGGKAVGRYKPGYEIIKGYHHPHPKFFHIIKEAFKMKLSGQSDYKIALYVNSNGYYRTIKKNGRKTYMLEKNLYKVWIDEFYYGMFINGDEIVNLLEWNEHFKPIITEEQHLILKSKYNEKSKRISKTKEEDIYSDIYQFSNDFITTDINDNLTFSLPNKHRYFNKLKKEVLEGKKIALKNIVKPHQIIYRCAIKGSKYYNLSINLDEVNKEIIKKLKYLKVSEEEFNKYIGFTNARLENLEDTTKNKINSITIQLNRKKSERTIYLQENMSLIKDENEQKVYDDKKKRLNEEIRFLRKQIEKEDDNERNEILELEMFIDMLNNAEAYYKRANYVQKGKIAKILFLNIKIDHQKRLLIQPKHGLETLFTRNWWSNTYQ